MSAFIGRLTDQSPDENTYEAVLNTNGKLCWIDRHGEREMWLEKEPQTSWWRRFSVGFMRILPIKSQL